MDERKRKRKLLFWAGGTLLLVLCLYGYATGWDAWSEVNQGLSNARKQGFPVEPSDLFGATTIADAEDAAPEYEELRILHVESRPLLKDAHRETFLRREASAYAFSRGSADYTMIDVLAYLADVREIIACAERATDKPSFRPRKDWSDPHAVLFNELAPAKYAATLFLIQAMIAAEQGDEKAALRCFQRVQVLAHHMRMYGHTLGFGVAVATESMYLRAVQIAVSTSGVEFELHDGLLADLETWPDRPDLTQPLRFAAFEATWLPRHVGQLRGDDVRSAWMMMQGVPKKKEEWEQFAWNMPGVQAEATQIGLDHWTRVLATYNVDSDDPVAWAIEMDSDLPVGSGYSQAASALSRMVSQEITRLVIAAQEGFARRRVVLSALRILRHPGSSPEEFLDVDPFTGTKLKYKKTPTGFVVYSVGNDRVDNDGETYSFAKSGSDIAFKYPFIRKAR